jgi:hypothetical protein
VRKTRVFLFLNPKKPTTMKRFGLLFVAFLVITLTAKSQSVFQMGAKAGGLSTWILNSRILSGESDTTYKTSIGYSIGVNGSFYFNGRSYYSHTLKGVSVELGYSNIHQGYKSKGTLPLTYNSKIDLSYIDLGVMLSIQPIADDGAYFLFGPQVSFLVSAKTSGSAIVDNLGNTVVPSYTRKDIKGSITGTNFGLSMEGGKFFNSRANTRMSYQIGVRVNYGFIDVTKPSRVDNLPYYKNHSAYFGLVFGVQFKGRNYYN